MTPRKIHLWIALGSPSHDSDRYVVLIINGEYFNLFGYKYSNKILVKLEKWLENKYPQYVDVCY